MKHLYICIAIAFATIVFISCEKDETKLEVIPASQANSIELNLSGANSYIAEESSQTIYPSILSWNKVNFGSPQILGSYTIQIDTTPNFTSRIEKSIGTNIFSYGLLGSLLNEWGISFNTNKTSLKKVTLFMRIGSSIYVNNPTSIINKPDTVFSAPVNISVTPIVAKVPVVYAPGNQQGWNPPSASKLYSKSRDNIYSGYVYLNGEFKITSEPNWEGTNYGKGSSSGTLSTTGDNLSAIEGYYWLSANLTALTYELTLVKWSIAGNAVAGTETDVVLSYNSVNKILSVTTPLNAGSFKFRRDGSWDISLGKGAQDGTLTAENGSEITIDTAGTYTITLDLSDLDNYTYSITRQ